MKTVSTPTLFCIKVTFTQHHIPTEYLDVSYNDYLKLLENKLGVHFDFIQIQKNQMKLYCSSLDSADILLEKNRKDVDLTLELVSEKIFSMFEPQTKTPIDIQWELM